MERSSKHGRINHLAPEGHKWCDRCSQFLPVHEFYPSSPYCKPCNKSYQKERRALDPDRYLRNKKTQRLKRFTMTSEDFDTLLASQGGVCAICRQDLQHDTNQRLSVDHDHSCCSGKGESCGRCIRGILCSNCNSGLGHFRDSPEVVQSALAYLLNWASMENA